ncbi:MAG TPA: RidA family protein [Actinomycetes bacterium]|jgi:enamine deaminase RidA (YjgF/YER057c/UK114 family)|nr:RidA family protein [Actinomycetes bacterium]
MAADWTKRVVTVPELFDSNAHAYEQCIAAGPLVFVAGQVGWDRDRRIVSDEFEPQARQAFENVRSALRAAGLDLDDLVAMTVFLTDARYDREFLRIRQEVMGSSYATSALITVSALFDPKLLVEIQGIAVRSA